jgi:hypothetical protein
VSCPQLERALTLISNNDINVEDVLAAGPAQHRSMVRAPKVLNKATGKETWTIHAFSVSNWGSQTLAFSKSVQAKGDEAIKTISSMAWKVLKKSKSQTGLESFHTFQSYDTVKPCHRTCTLACRTRPTGQRPVYVGPGLADYVKHVQAGYPLCL